jgi:hypothetical protein
VDEQGHADLRELYFDLSPVQVLDIRAGRQILTWGAGDLIFINDLFPKDFVSFFIGRNLEYLKVGSDAAKFSLYPGPFSLDLVAVPHFTPSEIPKGERLSFFNPFANRIAAPAKPVHEEARRNPGEYRTRLKALSDLRKWRRRLYGFGFFQGARRNGPGERTLFFPKLSVWRQLSRTLSQGSEFEFGYYDSRRTGGNKPLIENSP